LAETAPTITMIWHEKIMTSNSVNSSSASFTPETYFKLRY